MYTKLSTTLRKNSQGKKNRKPHCMLAALLALFAAGVSSAALSCSSWLERDNPIVIWTDNAEFASCMELFNSMHEANAVIVYKKDPARSLPPAKDELPPDLIVSPWLSGTKLRRNFAPVDYAFGDKKLKREAFYEKLLDYGRAEDRQYLLPVSFNLPAMVFNEKNASFIGDDHILTIEAIKEASAAFTVKDEKSGAYTAMGFAPSWNTDFVYQVTKLKNTGYEAKDASFSYDEEALKAAVNEMRNWTGAYNTDTQMEQSFQFKYLYMPEYKQLVGDRCLFTYMSSSEFFTLLRNSTPDLSFRWLSDGQRTMIADDCVYLGLYRHARSPRKAQLFIQWFFTESTQRQLLERSRNMKLDTEGFGIAGGFSSLKNVTNRIFPSYYRELLGNLPAEEYLEMPAVLPVRWQSIKRRVLLPYLAEAVNTNAEPSKTLEERIEEWNRQAE